MLDITLLLLLFAIPIIGFFQGAIRLLVLLVMFYISVVLASLFFTTLGRVLEPVSGVPLIISQYLSFALVLGVSFLLLSIAGLFLFRHVHIDPKFARLNYLGGVIVGMALAIFMTGTIAAIFWQLNNAPEIGETTPAPIRWLAAQGGGTLVSRQLMWYVFPGINTILAPILPGDAQMVLDVDPLPNVFPDEPVFVEPE